MTDAEININNEFSNEFDIFYNNITSNQAPGLDEYEKSVFLTKAQDEIVKAYFNPKTNKVQEGFDGSERRQIDFSMVVKSLVYESNLVQSKPSLNSYSVEPKQVVVPVKSTFINSSFDLRDTTKAVILEPNILMIINEYVTVTRGNNDTRLTVVPINYTEYSRLMSKPYKYPLKNQAWRLLDSSGGNNKAELIVGPNDIISKYVIRYVKKPRAIRLIDFDDVTIDGSGEAQSCELDPILFPEIIQRACELAKASYTGDLNSQIILGQASQTNIGMVTQSR